jgi:hypothetical protein
MCAVFRPSSSCLPPPPLPRCCPLVGQCRQHQRAAAGGDTHAAWAPGGGLVGEPGSTGTGGGQRGQGAPAAGGGVWGGAGWCVGEAVCLQAGG